jgi:hypothetical protein
MPAAYAVQNTFGILYFRNTMPPDSANSGQALRRWIANGDLIAHRGGVVRIAEQDLWAFLSSHRDD